MIRRSLVLICFFLPFIIYSCKPSSPRKQLPSDSSGKQLFAKNCVACHGADGSLGVSGARNLQQSVYTKEQIITQIKEGKGMMTSFKGRITDEDMALIADYVISLRK